MARASSSRIPFGLRSTSTALLILDMISDFDFPDGAALLRAARRIAPRIAALKTRTAKAGIPAIYVNDNLGPWRSDVASLLSRCLSVDSDGCRVVQQIAPADRDFVVLKPRHSGFYATPLAAMLEECGARRLIITGVSTHQCILFTANDAHLREFELCIPRDCVAAADATHHRFAIRYFSSVLNADTRAADRLRLKR
jgi:nicotinamidase-related amidase